MSAPVRSMPRWLIVTVIGAMLMTALALSGGGARAQDSTDATSTPTADATDTATTDAAFAIGDTVVVADGPLNLRDAASTSGTIVLVLPTGTPLHITANPTTADGYTWYEVQTDDHEPGWVAGEFLGTSGDTAPVFSEGDQVEVADGPLNVRDDASIDAAVLTQLATGDTATILSGPITSGDYDWYKITLEGESTGWVAGEFLAALSSGGGGDAEFAVGDALRVAVDHMNFRADAGTDAAVLNTLDLNALFVVRDGPVTADGYTWYQVFNFYYGEGWVAGELMTLDPNGFPGDGGS